MQNSYTLIEQKNYAFLVEVTVGGSVNKLLKIDIPYPSISKITSDNRIVTLNKGLNQLSIYSINDGTLLNTIDISLSKSLSMNMKDNVVYIGGEPDENLISFFMVDLSKKEYFAEKVELPKEILYAKSIVDILIIKNRMYLYDSLNKAKFSFEFDIEIANTPKLLTSLRLSREVEDYKIVKVQKNNNWVVYLLADTNTYNGPISKLIIEGDRSFKFDVGFNDQGELKYEAENLFKDIYLVDDKLYLLTFVGFGYFDLNKESLKVDDIVLVKHEVLPDRIVDIYEDYALLHNKETYELVDLKNNDIKNSTEEFTKREVSYFKEVEKYLDLKKEKAPKAEKGFFEKLLTLEWLFSEKEVEEVAIEEVDDSQEFKLFQPSNKIKYKHNEEDMQRINDFINIQKKIDKKWPSYFHHEAHYGISYKETTIEPIEEADLKNRIRDREGFIGFLEGRHNSEETMEDLKKRIKATEFPFHGSQHWIELKKLYKDSDQVFEFQDDYGSWGAGSGDRGILIVRNCEVIYTMMTTIS